MMFKVLIINGSHEQYTLLARVPVIGDRIAYTCSEETFVTVEVTNVTLSAYPLENANPYPSTHTTATVFVKPITQGVKLAGERSLSQQVVETGASRKADKLEKREKPIHSLTHEIDSKISGLFTVIYHHEKTINPILEQVPCYGEEKECQRPEPSQLVDVLRDFSDRITQAIEHLKALTERSQV